MRSSINKILDGYGSFFALSHPASRILIFIAAMLQPFSGIAGITGAIGILFWRKCLQFNTQSERIEIINGLLLGMLIGSIYGISAASILLIFFAVLLVVLGSALFTDTIGRSLKLPLLGLPYSAVAYIVLPLAASIHLPTMHINVPTVTFALPLQFLNPLGAMYFNGTSIGGLLVFAAFCLSSRYLALLAVAASLCSSAFLNLAGVPSYALISLIAQMNSVLAACVIGGLFAVPGKRSLLVSLGAAVFSSALTLAMNNLFAIAGLPVLALPFVFVTYLCMLIFNAQRGPAWAYFWLSVPALPEVSLEQIQISEARGVDLRCIALKPPFKGEWQIYQGMGGEHTHKGNWHYALDFFKSQGGVSFDNDGIELSDYRCFGCAVLSPAYGSIVDCRGDLPDNRPGEVDTVNNWGNYVLIRLDCGAYVILAHLQQASIKVVPGTRVRPGDLLAAVGNSGRSPQPHLHMHVQETAYLGANTIPFHLNGVMFKNEQQDLFQIRSCPGEEDTICSPVYNHAFKRSLHLAVGNRFTYKVAYADGRVALRCLEVKLDLYGQFWLESDRGGRVAFALTDELLVFYNRQGNEDEFLDAFVLAVACTPFVEGSFKWQDLIPGRLLPRKRLDRLAHAFLFPLNPCARSSFKRQWDNFLRMWSQTGEHRIGSWSCTTNVHICEAQGIVDFDLQIKGNAIMKGSLLRWAAGEDHGIPEWSSILPRVS